MIDSTHLPEEKEALNGYCVRLVAIGSGTELCQEMEYFWNSSYPDAFAVAEAFARDYLDPSISWDLSEGTYRVSIHSAWKGNDTEPHDWDTDVLEQVVFKLTKNVNIEAI